MKPKLTLINWSDAISPTSSWTDIKDLKHELADCISIGLVVYEDEKTITIVSHISGDEEGVDIDGSLVLDKTWIKFRKDLPIPAATAERIGKWLERKDAKKT
tara:strand:+ start:594 stop:899 length:306 start_codon:yes stop_codon:yes gene_type:complete